MNRIISILLGIVFVQFLIFLYIKLIYEKNLPSTPVLITTQNTVVLAKNYSNAELEALVNTSIKEIMHEAKKLPKSNQYTVWDKEMIAHISQKILQQTAPKPIQKEINSKKEPKLVKKNLQDKTKVAETKKLTSKKIVKKTTVTRKVEKFAKARLGKKYVWGAIGPNQFDCSGFTREVFRCTVGITIPRVSREQAKVGKYIKYKDLQRGDMVFFDTEKKYTGKVNHVGIYLSNGNFIHASSAKKKVIITSFRKKPFYKKRFLWGRRVLKNKS